MTQTQNAQSVALQVEKVRDKLPLLYERDDILLTIIQQRGEVERVSSRNLRPPVQIRPGGKAGLANMDGGDLGRGSGSVYDVAQVSPTFSDLHRRAAIGLGIERERAYVPMRMGDCPACGEKVKLGVAVCKHCAAILDEEKAAKHGLGAGAAAERAARMDGAGLSGPGRQSRS